MICYVDYTYTTFIIQLTQSEIWVVLKLKKMLTHRLGSWLDCMELIPLKCFRRPSSKFRFRLSSDCCSGGFESVVHFRKSQNNQNMQTTRPSFRLKLYNSLSLS